MNKILVVEDDFYLRRNLKEILISNGFCVVTASSAGEAVRYVQTEQDIDLYILDIWLPDGDGFEICKEIQMKNHRPVIFLSVCEDEESVVKGLNIGGDDYVVKPYRTKELLSRISANLRKYENQNQGTFWKSKDLVLDTVQGSVKVTAQPDSNHLLIGAKRQEEVIRLTPIEFSLLLKLMENAECIVKREQLMACIGDELGIFKEDNTLSVNMSRLRNKIGADKIETIRGFGYRFVGKVHREIYE